MRNPHSIMEFPLGKPTVISLKYRTGKPGRNQFGDFVTYSLTNGKLAFLPPEADQAIQSLHLNANEAFQIMRRKNGGSGFAWDVERLPKEVHDTEAGAPPSPDRDARSSLLVAKYSDPTTNGVSSPVAPSLATPESQRLSQQLIAATEAVRAAQAYATSIGLQVKFNACDIRALAISGFISQGRG